MSEPTLTDGQREALLATMPIGGSGWRQLRYPEQTFAAVAAMLADERAAREAAEAEARRNRAALAALRLRRWDKALAECEQDLAAAIDRAEAAEAKVRDLTAGIGALVEGILEVTEGPNREGTARWVEPMRDGYTIGALEAAEKFRALVDDPAAALVEVRAEAWDEGYRDARDDAWCETDTPNPYRAEAERDEGHVCDTGHFDRTICPEPCGMMHSYCTTCGKRADSCAHEAEGAGR